MLQQTTVEAVRPRYERFLSRFPDVAALARAREDEVLAEWSGLGYYERARNLRRAAVQMVRESGGVVPDTADSLARLPGVGRYTAGAIASIAFGRAEPILDGNVARLLSRLFAVGGDPRAAATKAQLWDLAGSLVDPADPSSLNQALMEMGALVCRPRDPACPECPVAAECAARGADAVERYPRRAERKPATEACVVAALVRDARGRILLVRRSRAGAMRGLWELPSVEVSAAAASGPAGALARRLRDETGLSLRIGPLVASARHAVMNRKIFLQAFRAELVEPKRAKAATRAKPATRAEPATRAKSPTRAAPEIAWAAPARLDRYPHSSLLTKVLEKTRPARDEKGRRDRS